MSSPDRTKRAKHRPQPTQQPPSRANTADDPRNLTAVLALHRTRWISSACATLLLKQPNIHCDITSAQNLRDEIKELYPLRTRARDSSVADLEIACDAAVTVAEAYNNANPDSTSINLRWFYACVQSLLAIELKPEVFLDGQVERLRDLPISIVSDFVSEIENPLSGCPSPQPASDTYDSALQAMTPSSNGSKTIPAKAAKAKWDDDEIRRMVELKASGLSHREVAEKLGRGQGSVENKYGRMMQMDYWKDHSTCYVHGYLVPGSWDDFVHHIDISEPLFLFLKWQNMVNDEDLPSIAQNAVEQALRYRNGRDTGLAESYKAVIKDRIEQILPLKSLAADPAVANLEIVSDAALSFLDAYNLEHLDHPLNQRWLYISVQALAAIDLKPVLVCGDVRRLPTPSLRQAVASTDLIADCTDDPQPEETELDTESGPNIDDHEILAAQIPTNDDETEDERASDDDYEPRVVKTPGAAKAPRARKKRSSGPVVAKGKDPWSDEEIGRLIKMKIRGLTHKEIGAILGRSEPACAIRHSIVLKEAEWMNFAQAYREKRAAGEMSDSDGENDEGREDEVMEESDQTLGDEEMTQDTEMEEVEQMRENEGAKEE
ncbi:hypothetical protein J7T55_013693 [Diaporthe amygdali]|uniref:uncharacterized protein n=1 Tax=Phomopsis amygdali TaxID=1214568 RepID=UPI0022FF1797|nr:uncharacterized protein J7T55_013693 [Diaporthe amygdali]KAJ0119491.1 hypothetical protein J7T55_013693 [Diaporthe amygdali]